MGRLKLLGEQEGGGTDDHSALSNLGYAQSGHTGFVPSQGEALIDILRLNQNLIRDSGGNNRLQLSASSPHISLIGGTTITEEVGLMGCTPQANVWLKISPLSKRAFQITALEINPGSTSISGNDAKFRGVFGAPGALVDPGSINTSIFGLTYNAKVSGGGEGATVSKLVGVQTYIGWAAFSGTVMDSIGLEVTGPAVLFPDCSATNCYGIKIANQGQPSVPQTNIYGLQIADQTNGANCYLIEAGPSTPYLRLLGGGDPPADKSNLYLKFGSTLYRVVKTGNYMTLEAS